MAEALVRANGGKDNIDASFGSNALKYHTQEATVYLCHAYTNNFMALVDALRQFDDETGKKHYYYYDLFIQDQAGKSDIQTSDLRDLFSGAAKVDKTLLLLDWTEGKARPECP